MKYPQKTLLFEIDISFFLVISSYTVLCIILSRAKK